MLPPNNVTHSPIMELDGHGFPALFTLQESADYPNVNYPNDQLKVTVYIELKGRKCVFAGFPHPKHDSSSAQGVLQQVRVKIYHRSHDIVSF